MKEELLRSKKKQEEDKLKDKKIQQLEQTISKRNTILELLLLYKEKKCK